MVVVGNSGAIVADTLAPYHLLATKGAFNVYTVAPDRRPLPPLGGLVVPGTDAAASPDPDVTAAARRAGVPVAYLHQKPGFAFDAALRDMARTMDVPTARWAAKILEAPTTGLGLSGPGWPWTLALRLLLLGLVGLAAAVGAVWMLRTRRNRRQRAEPAQPAQPAAQAPSA